MREASQREPATDEPGRPTPSAVRAVSGQAMDAPRPGAGRPWFRRRRPLLFGVGTVALAAMAAYGWSASAERPFRLDATAVTLAVVSSGTFDDFVPVRAQAVPSAVLVIDAPQSGQVEQTFVEDGNRVSRGQVLARLGNPAFQLEALSRDAELQQRLNATKEAEIALERQRLDDDTRLSESAYRAKVARSELDKQRILKREGFVSEALLQRAEDESLFSEDRLQARREGARRSQALLLQQQAQLRVQASQLRETLAATRRLLDGLVLRAQADGTLTGFALKPGQAVSAGSRIGQIDGSDDFKLLGSIDEYYLPRVSVGQSARLGDATTNGLVVRRVLPQVVGGQFQVELAFVGAAPTGLRRGQTLDVRLNLGAPAQALLLPNAAFLSDSGGGFVFRLAQGGIARKTPVRLGRRNVRSVEVLAGLAAGDRVITSSYADYARLSSVSIEGIQ